MSDKVPPEIEQVLALRPLCFQGLTALLQELGAYKLCRAAWQTRTLVGHLPETDLVQLIKAFVLLEELAPRAFCAGSTTQVPYLLNALGTANPDLGRELTVWAFHMTSNPYVPFGTSNASRGLAQTTEEYARMEALRSQTRQNLGDRALAAAKERRAARASAHTQRVSSHVGHNGERTRLVAKLLELTPADRLVQLCQNQDRPPGYFPIEVVDLAAIGQLSSEQQRALLEWLRFAPRGPWQRVRSAVEFVVLKASAAAGHGH